MFVYIVDKVERSFSTSPSRVYAMNIKVLTSNININSICPKVCTAK